MEEHEKIEIRSDEVQEILTSVPSWMIRWGITLIFAVLVGCVILSYFIKYPDVISGPVTLTTVTPPTRLVSKTNGEIEQLLVADNELVEKGDVIAQIRNPLSKEAVIYLGSKMEEVEQGLEGEFKSEIDFNQGEMVFGGVQLAYNDLVKTISTYRYELSSNQYQKRRNILQTQISNYRKLNKITARQLANSTQNYDLATDQYESNKTLYDKGVISKTEFYTQEKDFTQVKNEIENLKKVQVQNTITLTDYQRQLNELEIDFLNKKINLTKSIETNLNSIRNEINNWEETYLITSPMAGKVNYLTQLSVNQYIESGKPLFAVIPQADDELIGYINLSKVGYGKVAVGQEVKIKFDNYPADEFGQVTGLVQNISVLPNEEQYLVQVKLDEGLKTTYKKELPYTPEMSGTADVITEDLRILERIFNQFRELFDN